MAAAAGGAGAGAGAGAGTEAGAEAGRHRYGIGDSVVVKFFSHGLHEKAGIIIGYLVQLENVHDRGEDSEIRAVQTGNPKSKFLLPEQRMLDREYFRITDGQLVEPMRGGGKSKSRTRRHRRRSGK